MTIESYLILENVSTESTDLSVYTYSDKKPGAGYSLRNNGLHTVQFQLDNFKGAIKLQGTLEKYPGEADWIDLNYDSGNSLDALDSSVHSTDEIRNFTGNWLWIRVGYVLEQGTIQSIRYNF